MNAMHVKAVAAALFAASFAGAAPAAPATGHEHPAAIPAAGPVVRTDAALRDLWLGHVFWVRNVALETLAGNRPAAEAAEKEVVANAHAIAAAIEPFYGKAAGEKLFDLLAGHYGAVKQYLSATVDGSQAKQETALERLTANAGDIARFLSGANPNLPYAAVNSLLLAHGGHHVKQIQQLKAGDYADEAQTWAAMKDHMYQVADTLTSAIAQQFPARFVARAD